MDCKKFNDGECNIKLHDSVRNAHVFVVQSTCPGRTSDRTINDHIMELFLLVRCFRRASAATVTAIIPYYGFAPPPPPARPPCTNRTRRVPYPVLIGHAASLTPY